MKKQNRGGPPFLTWLYSPLADKKHKEIQLLRWVCQTRLDYLLARERILMETK